MHPKWMAEHRVMATDALIWNELKGQAVHLSFSYHIVAILEGISRCKSRFGCWYGG